ncbi:hypothetical protein NIES22_04640 [Calothrix brevissima NIES-22]|nr:hypothetical protein NIES22_04640 [Calothrix brevissima NIES-22]
MMTKPCQLNAKPALSQAFYPHPQPLSLRERGARDLIPLLLGRGEQEIQFPFSLREKGLGDEGESFCTTRAVYSF